MGDLRRKMTEHNRVDKTHVKCWSRCWVWSWCIGGGLCGTLGGRNCGSKAAMGGHPSKASRCAICLDISTYPSSLLLVSVVIVAYKNEMDGSTGAGRRNRTNVFLTGPNPFTSSLLAALFRHSVAARGGASKFLLLPLGNFSSK